MVSSKATQLLVLGAAVVQGLTLRQAPKCQSRAATWEPQVGASWQIVLQGSLNIDTKNPSVVPAHAEIFDIDLFTNTNNGKDDSKIQALHSLGKKVICYFSAGTYEDYRPDSSRFTAADKGNKMEDWDEWWINVASSNVRDIMRDRIKMAADMGCDGIDPDNVDGYGEAPVNNKGKATEFKLSHATTTDYVKWMAAEAAQYKMAIGLKNAGEVIDDVLSVVQFSVNEECAAYEECNMFKTFINAKKPVFHIEYPNGDDDENHTPVRDTTKWCTSASDWSGANADISSFSTVIKSMNLDGWTQYCDKKEYTTST